MGTVTLTPTPTTPGTDADADATDTHAPETPAPAPGPPPAYRFQTDAHAVETTAVTTRAIAARLPATLRRAWHLGWHADRRAVLTLTACTLAYALLTATALHSTNTLLTALLTPGPAADRLTEALPALLLVTTTASTAYLTDAAARLTAARLAPQVHREADLAVIDAATRAELGAYHDPHFEDTRFAATTGAEKTPELITQTQHLAITTAQFTAATLVTATLNPLLLPLLLLAAAPRIWGAVRAARIDHTAAHRTLADGRLRRSLAQYATDSATAAEIRAGTMAGFLTGQYRIVSRRLESEQHRAARRATLTQGTGDLLATLAMTALWSGIAYLILTAQMSLATAATTALVVRTANAALTASVRAAASLFTTSLYITDWAAFLDQAGTWTMRRGTAPAPAAGPQRITARQLTYTYPGATTPAVNGIDLDIQRGEVIALVGENGSGKTTLAKLLTGLYLPTHGTVTWDDTPLTDLDPHHLWRTTSVVPQDYTRWQLAARENITLGQPHPTGDQAVHEAARQAGADTVITNLPHGLDTSLARSFWGGHDLSGGQWQRIALARGFHRDAPLIVLDEPTAALDARVEHQILTRLRDLAAGRTAIFITHRLASTRTADRVIVLKNGQISQTGTYGALRQAPGLFAELHDLQGG
ncbi:ABC transporter ATP-binding protein [Streptomyces jumonjinensis]|uniref:ABC transporter ATP-binding protein n=1 Tax=Streptomyces jumonjinensis TaxID=1945 RepID=UPI00379A68F4